LLVLLVLLVLLMLMLLLVLLVLVPWWRPRGSRHGGTSLVAHRDQQRGDVLAVLPGLLERRTGAVRGDALAAEANRDLVRIGVGTLDSPLRGGVVHVDVFDDLALLVVETA
jgi:hypothetical protein